MDFDPPGRKSVKIRPISEIWRFFVIFSGSDDFFGVRKKFRASKNNFPGKKIPEKKESRQKKNDVPEKKKWKKGPLEIMKKWYST